MKNWIIVATVLVVSLLVSACQPPATPTPDVQGTVKAQVDSITTQTAIAQTQAALKITQTTMAQARADWMATQTAAAQAQSTAAAKETAIEATRKAVGVSPTSTSTPLSPGVTASPTLAPAPATTPPPIATTTRVPTPAPCQVPGVTLPFYIYADWGSGKNHYVPKGWMGDIGDIQFDDNYKLDPSRPNVMRITYTPKGSNQWAGIYWWDPPGADWANIDGGFNLSCATKLTFWARGDKGGEKAEFKVGGLNGAFKDSLQPARSTGPLVLTKEWKQYTLELNSKELNHIMGGFVWVTNKPSNPNGATIYLDEIRFE